MKKKSELVNALCKEIVLRKDEIKSPLDTIYFGGGTPSLLEKADLVQIFDTISKTFSLTESPEITLEANPDDLSLEKLQMLSSSGINRLSIGVQSFFEEDLKLMNRAHNAQEATQSLTLAAQYFENISLDLIYGIPGMSNARWNENLDHALDLNIPHISSYALTVEPNTALKKFIEKGKIKPVNDSVAQSHFNILKNRMKSAGFDHYEFSNYGKPGFYSRNNTAYWTGKSYLGIGPSAHSYDGDRRSWNVANNTRYIKSLEEDKLSIERETLSLQDKYNEYIMTGLRTARGISLTEIEASFGPKYANYVRAESRKHLQNKQLLSKNDRFTVAEDAQFFTDGIASDLFMIDES